LFISEDILEEIAKCSNQYARTKSGELSGIKSCEIKVFFGILLLSGNNSLTNYELYWSLDGGRKVCTRNVGLIGDHEICYADSTFSL